MLFTRRLNLWVSLPRNEVELARAAIEAGADAIKVHMSVDHFASGTHFGTFEEEEASIREIIKVAEGRPVGLVPGGSPSAVPKSLQPVADLGISFISVYAHHCPAHWLSGAAPVAIGVAPNHAYPRELIRLLPRTGITMLEASVMPPDRYGEPVTAADLALYHYIRSEISLPMVVPSQLKWTPDDIPALTAIGVNALMIGAVVTGDTAEHLAEATVSLRRAIDAY